jgi:hypothetical protein
VNSKGELNMEWFTTNWESLFVILTQVVGVAALVATLTPNTSDNKAVDFVLNIINMLGANVGKSKNKTD